LRVYIGLGFRVEVSGLGLGCLGLVFGVWGLGLGVFCYMGLYLKSYIQIYGLVFIYIYRVRGFVFRVWGFRDYGWAVCGLGVLVFGAVGLDFGF
jgi:hypothetical protein